MNDRDLQRLLDTQALNELKARYCIYLDTNQWDAFRDLFAEDLVLEGTSKTGITRDQFVDGVAAGLSIPTAHQILPGTFEWIDETHVRAVFAMRDELIFPEGDPRHEGLPRLIGFGHYEEELRKENGGVWRICFLRLASLFTRRYEDGKPVERGVPSDGRRWLVTGERGTPA
jgi:SnoaL-like domain